MLENTPLAERIGNLPEMLSQPTAKKVSRNNQPPPSKDSWHGWSLEPAVPDGGGGGRGGGVCSGSGYGTPPSFPDQTVTPPAGGRTLAYIHQMEQAKRRREPFGTIAAQPPPVMVTTTRRVRPRYNPTPPLELRLRDNPEALLPSHAGPSGDDSLGSPATYLGQFPSQESLNELDLPEFDEADLIDAEVTEVLSEALPASAEASSASGMPRDPTCGSRPDVRGQLLRGAVPESPREIQHVNALVCAIPEFGSVLGSPLQENAEIIGCRSAAHHELVSAPGRLRLPAGLMGLPARAPPPPPVPSVAPPGMQYRRLASQLSSTLLDVEGPTPHLSVDGDGEGDDGQPTLNLGCTEGLDRAQDHDWSHQVEREEEATTMMRCGVDGGALAQAEAAAAAAVQAADYSSDLTPPSEADFW